jgi:molecular chaperone HtpG
MTERFQVDLRGIIELLSGHLYSSPSVFIRELLQNAVDAITARREIDPAHDGRVRFEFVEPKHDGATLIVEDNGIGLSESEIHRFLATIGASSKKQLPSQRSTFIGQFGIGILSCFMVTDEIVILTRKAEVEGASFEWRGRSDGSYQLRKLARQLEPGTRVILKLRPDETETFDGEQLEAHLRRYGEMLSIPVDLVRRERARRINLDSPPWDLKLAQERDALNNYARSTFGFEPLEIVPLASKRPSLRGVAFVLPAPAGTGIRQRHRVYLKNMLVTEDAAELIPEWAFFVSCVVNSEDLRPTASREDFFKDCALEKARDSIAASLRSFLKHAARFDRLKFDSILTLHDLAIRAMAVEDDDLFEWIVDLLAFETSMGKITLGQYRRENSVLRVAPTVDQFRQIAGVAAAQGIWVFNGGFTYHQELLEKAPEFFANLTFEVVSGSDLIQFLEEPLEDVPETIDQFLHRADESLRPYEVVCELREFKPALVPAVLGVDQAASFRRSVDLSNELANDHWRELLSPVRNRSAGLRTSTLCFNYACPLVRELIDLQDRSLQNTLVQLLYVQALLLGFQPLSSREMNTLTHGLTSLMLAAMGAPRRPGA